MDSVTFIKTGETGSRKLNLKDKYNIDFVVLNENMTKYIYNEIKRYCNIVAPKIIDCIEKHKIEILDIKFKKNDLQRDKLLILLVLIYVDFICEEMLNTLNEFYQNLKPYNKKWSITGYTNINDNTIFRNDTFNYEQGKVALFTYGNGNIEKFNKFMFHSDIPIFKLENYVQYIYIINETAQILRNNTMKEIGIKLENDIPEYLKNQIGFVLKNYMPYLRYEIIDYCIKHEIIDRNYDKIQFMLIYE